MKQEEFRLLQRLATSPPGSSLQHPMGMDAREESDDFLTKDPSIEPKSSSFQYHLDEFAQASDKYAQKAPGEFSRRMLITGTDNDEHSKPDSTLKMHKCPYCDTEFMRHHNLKSHLLTHSQEKPYLCQTCNLRFRRLHDLKRHGKLHVGEEPHVCPKCDRKFARGDALARHKQGRGGCAGRRASAGSYGDQGEGDGAPRNEGDDTSMGLYEGAGRGVSNASDGEEEDDHGGTSQGVEVSKSPETAYASNKDVDGAEWRQSELVWPGWDSTRESLPEAAFRPHGGFVGLEDDLRQSHESAVNTEDMGYPGRSETASSVRTKTSSVSENEGTIYDGTTWYGPTWLSTASDPAMALGDAYRYTSLEGRAAKKVIHALQEHQGNSNESGGQGTQSWSPAPSITSQTDPRTSSKRKLGHDETEREQGPVIKKGRKQIQDGQPRLACHFQKMDPVKWARCGMREAGFARISDIKQHFRRHHMRNPNYCPICGSTFPSEEAKNDHIRQSRANPAICPEQSIPHLPDGISHDKLQLLTERVKASTDISGQWYSIWAILFPDVTPPPTCTYDLSDRLHNSVRDLCLFLETEGPAIGQSVLEEADVIIGPSRAANVDLADFNMGLFTRRVLSRVFNETVQSWISQESSDRNLLTGSSGHVSVPLTPISGSSNGKRSL